MRLSSNVIKGVRAFVNHEDVRTIDSDMNAKFRPLSAISQREYIKTPPEEDLEEGQDLYEEDEEEVLSPFEFLEKEREGFLKEAEKILNDARNEAWLIKQEAGNEAEKMKIDALAQGHEQGYRDGMEKAMGEVQKMKQELLEKSKEMDLKYEQARRNLEPEMAQVLIGLVGNLTGVILENEKSVILHLVARAMGRITRNDLFIIHISRADYSVLEKRKPLLEKLVGQNKKITLVEEEDMEKGQCRIETDDQIIDCGMDTQLGNLFENILLLAKV